MGSHHPIRKFVAPEPVAIPDKLYFRIGDVARLCQVPAYVLRFWETEFPNLKPNKGGTGQRLYRRKDVEMALRIKTLLYDEGYTIPGARQVFKTDAQSLARQREISGSTVLPGPAGTATASAATQPLETAKLETVPPETAQPIDMGASIRRGAHQENHLRSLRDELRKLLTQLGGPAFVPAVAAPPAIAPAAAKPLRPRLMLEPKPELKSEPKSAPRHESNLHVAQGDLFSSE
jgi:DNA-binding transcriptional MerR regulator